MTKAHTDQARRKLRPGLTREECLPRRARSRLPSAVSNVCCLRRENAGLAPREHRARGLRGGGLAAGRAREDRDAGPSSGPGPLGQRPGLRPTPPAPLLTGGPRAASGWAKDGGRPARGPGSSVRACSAAASRMAARDGRGLRARRRARGRWTDGRGLTGSEFGAALLAARANQIADRPAPLCGERAGTPGGGPASGSARAPACQVKGRAAAARAVGPLAPRQIEGPSPAALWLRLVSFVEVSS